MKSRFFSMLMCAVLICSCLSGCSESKPVMNTETSRYVMDELINSEKFAVKVTYEGMNLEFFYEKYDGKEFLSTNTGGVQSAIIRANGYTYYIDVVGKKEVRCLQGDTTELNYAYQLLDTIYNQTVVSGELTMTRHLGTEKHPVTIDNYTYNDAENDMNIDWVICVTDNMIAKATRSTDGYTFAFEYPEPTEEVFYIPEDYNIEGGPRPDFS